MKTILSPTRLEVLLSHCESDREEAEDISHLDQPAPISPFQSSVTVKVAKKFCNKKAIRHLKILHLQRRKKLCLENIISLNQTVNDYEKKCRSFYIYQNLH